MGSLIYFWKGKYFGFSYCCVAVMTEEKNMGECSYFGFIYFEKLRLNVSYLWEVLVSDFLMWMQRKGNYYVPVLSFSQYILKEVIRICC